MDLHSLSEAFIIINANDQLPDYVKKVCQLIIDKSIDKKAIEQILREHNVSDLVSIYNFIDLIIEYIITVLGDNLLSDSEISNIKLLKILFGVKPGEFWHYRKNAIEEIIRYQLSRIYSDDNITHEEALLKVGLQEIFDLGFDEMNE